VLTTTEFRERAREYLPRLGSELGVCDCDPVQEVISERYRRMEGLAESDEPYKQALTNAMESGAVRVMVHDIENLRAMGEVPFTSIRRIVCQYDSILTAHCSTCDTMLEVIPTSKFSKIY
jgi:hypothetical protein